MPSTRSRMAVTTWSLLTLSCGPVCGDGTVEEDGACIVDTDDVAVCDTTTRQTTTASCQGLDFEDCSDGSSYRLYCDTDGCYCVQDDLVVGEFDFDLTGCEAYWESRSRIESAFAACGLGVTAEPSPPTE